MAMPFRDMNDFRDILKSRFGKKPMFGIFLYDSRVDHRDVLKFVRKSKHWLHELANQCGITILFPVAMDGRQYENPSSLIGKHFGLQSNRLPGIVLLETPKTRKKYHTTDHFLYIPLEAADFSNISQMQETVSDIFSIVHTSLIHSDGNHYTLELIQIDLRKRRKRKSRDKITQSIRSGAKIILKDLPERFGTSFVESLGKTWGERLAKL